MKYRWIMLRARYRECFEVEEDAAASRACFRKMCLSCLGNLRSSMNNIFETAYASLVSVVLGVVWDEAHPKRRVHPYLNTHFPTSQHANTFGRELVVLQLSSYRCYPCMAMPDIPFRLKCNRAVQAGEARGDEIAHSSVECLRIIAGYEALPSCGERPGCGSELRILRCYRKRCRVASM